MNIYWPIYKNLESEFLKIMYYVHIDDKQMSVYSSKIADLILRAAIEIESICKELYTVNGGEKNTIRRFDDEVLDDMLVPAWSLDKKVVIVSSHNCFQTQRDIFPFKKTEKKASKAANETFSWNNAYQNLKHNRGKSLSYGSIKYLFDIMAALFLLNLYYKNETIQLECDYKGLALSPAMGSEIFAIEIVACGSKHEINKVLGTELFSRSTYCIKMTDDTAKIFYEKQDLHTVKMYELAYEDQLAQQYIAKHDEPLLPSQLVELLGINKIGNYCQQALQFFDITKVKNEFEAVLNTNQFCVMPMTTRIPTHFWSKK